MASADNTPSAAPDPDATPSRDRVRRMFAGSRELARIVYRDPEHGSERLTLYSVDRLADASLEWAHSARNTRADTSPAEIAEELRIQTAQIARIDVAISGTPFLIALAPGYLTYLYQEMRMTLRSAALYGRDPRDLKTAGEMLAWVLPFTFMIMMAWGCETHARRLGRRTLGFYDGEAAIALAAGRATEATTSAHCSAPSRCSSRWRSRSASLRWSTTTATPSASTGSVRSAH